MSLGGGMTRRYHGLLIAALPAPYGRVVMVNHVRVTATVGGRRVLLDHENLQQLDDPDAARLAEFRLEGGLPVWEYVTEGARIEKRLMMPHQQNTTHVAFRLLSADRPVSLELRPMFHVRPHEEALSDSPPRAASVTQRSERSRTAWWRTWQPMPTSMRLRPRKPSR